MDQKKTVLVVEDEVPMLEVLSQKLEESGFTALQAKDGEEALAVSLSKHPDLILLDILMPKMDGMTMMQKLREDAWGKTAPVIILTNVSPDTDTTIKGIINFQPAYYLVKADTDLEGIIAKVRSILEQKPS